MAVALFAALALTATSSAGGLAVSDEMMPTRLYYQVNRPMPLTIPAEAPNRELVVLTHMNAEIARAAVPADAEDAQPSTDTFEVDAAELLPQVWDLRKVHYLQLLVDGEPAGPALVLQPLVTPPAPRLRAMQTPNGPVPVVQEWVPVPEEHLAMAGLRVYPEEYAVMHTTMGDITVAMRPDEAPNTCFNFLHLVEGGFYTDIPFHRVVAVDGLGKPFVIQAGDPTGSGEGGPGFKIDLEATQLPHDLGVISMARESFDIHTAGSQFFICLSREGTSRLDVQYGSFGQTIGGISVVKQIAALETDPASQRPKDMPFIKTSELIPAQPRTPGEAPNLGLGALDGDTGSGDAEGDDTPKKDADAPVDR
jgi:peptidyl-prolyl cis-trans isomerase B (cyclophilin B)